MGKSRFYRTVGKRLFDVSVSLLALPIVGVAAAVVAPLVKIDDGGPILFVSMRRGLRGKPFAIYKFRSMKVAAPDLRNADGSTVNGNEDPRVTRVGRVLRRTSVDELPQILNVLKGDMSLVGPRPNMATRRYEDLRPEERKRLEVLPGLTGVAQAKGRNSLSVEERRELDDWYVDNVSLGIDLRILADTASSVLTQRGIHSGVSRDG